MGKAISLRDDAHWHELRAQHVGGSEVSALFGEHAQLTKYELWQIKAGRIAPADLSDNDRVFWGTVLEPAVAEGVRRKTGWNVRKVRRYYSCLPELGAGASLDYEVVANERGPGVLEIKTADWLVTKNWEDDSPPLAYELQLQHEMAAANRAWGCMAVLVGGNDLRLFHYEKRPTTAEIIEREIRAFWQSVNDNQPPAPDFTRDTDTIKRVYGSAVDGKVIDLGLGGRAEKLVAEYQAAAALGKDADARKDAAKGELLQMISDAETALCGTAKISAKMVSGSHVEYDRKPYRDFRISVSKK